MKKLILIVIIIFVALMNYAPAISQNIETIIPRTYHTAFDSGNTTVLKYSSNGTFLMFNHNGELYLISSDFTEKILDVGANKTITKCDFDEYYNYLFYSIDNETKTRITGYATQKKSDSLDGDFYLTKDYLILKLDNTYDGNNIYYNFKRVNVKDLSKVDSISIVRTQTANYRFDIDQINPIYQQNKIYFEEVNEGYGSNEGLTTKSWFEIDFNTLKFNEVNINNGVSGKVILSEDGSLVVTYSKVFE